MITVYGIPNCDIIKKTTQWLTGKHITFQFYDHRKQGIGREKLKDWCTQVGWETLFNKRSTTWKELDPSLQATLTNEKTAIDLMAEHTTLIRRPVVEKNGKVVAVGYDEKLLGKLIKGVE